MGEKRVTLKNEIPKIHLKLLMAIFLIQEMGIKRYTDIVGPLFTHQTMGVPVFVEDKTLEEIEITKPEQIYETKLRWNNIVSPVIRYNPDFVNDVTDEDLKEKFLESLNKLVE